MKPKPVVTATICSECGLDWDLHGENPTQSDCIRLLKTELAMRPTTITYPVYPYIQPYKPYWWHTYGTPNTLPINVCGTITNTVAMTTSASDDKVTYTYESPAPGTVNIYAVAS